MSQHPEIIAAPYTIWIAPVGTAFPSVDADPGEDWALLGVNGARNMSEGGLSVVHQQNWASPAPPAGQTAPTTTMLESEDLRLRVELLDLTLEQYAFALGSNAITAVPRAPGVPGTRTLGLSIGPRNAAEFALLARGPSPYIDGLAAQYELPRCAEGGSPEVVFRKGVPAGLDLEFRALPDPAAACEATRFGRLVAQDSTAVIALTGDDDLYLLTATDLFLEI